MLGYNNYKQTTDLTTTTNPVETVVQLAIAADLQSLIKIGNSPTARITNTHRYPVLSGVDTTHLVCSHLNTKFCLAFNN